LLPASGVVRALWIVCKFSSDNFDLSSLYKEIISKDPRSEEAKTALIWLYSIVRADYAENKLGEKDWFFDYLQDIRNKAGEAETGKLALRYMIFWKMLENDDVAAIALSKQALKVVTDEEKEWVLVDLAFTYIHSGQVQEAKNTLQELKEKYSLDEELKARIEEAIADLEGQIADGQWKPDEKAKPLEPEPIAPKTAGLSQNYPNPFNPETAIRFYLNERQKIQLVIYDVTGQRVRTLVEGEFPIGEHTISWDGRDQHGKLVASGIYFYELLVGNKVERRKMTLIR
jgi:hypothetical protein